MGLFRENLEEKRVICGHESKTRFFGLYFCRRQYGSNLPFDVTGPEASGHYMVQGHSRSHISVPIERHHAIKCSV